MAKYDNGILQQYADDLYAKAAWIAWKYGIIGAVLGMLVIGIPLAIWDDNARGQAIVERHRGTGNGFNLPPRDPSTPNGTPLIGIGIVCLICAAIGSQIGIRKGFQYRLQAQTMLCQMQIEFNTRRLE